MKIKLIVILFGISCLFFPGGMMEAEASAIGIILKGAKALIEHGANAPIVKVQTGKITIKAVGIEKNNWCLQNPESCTANNEIMYTELSLDKYGIKSIQTPSSWSPHEMGSFTDDDGFREDILRFTDLSLTVINFSSSSSFSVANFLSNSSSYVLYSFKRLVLSLSPMTLTPTSHHFGYNLISTMST